MSPSCPCGLTEEDQVRKHFNMEFGANLPEDLCLCIENSPTRWEVVPSIGDAWEFLPAIERDLLTEASDDFFVWSFTT